MRLVFTNSKRAIFTKNLEMGFGKKLGALAPSPTASTAINCVTDYMLAECTTKMTQKYTVPQVQFANKQWTI